MDPRPCPNCGARKYEEWYTDAEVYATIDDPLDPKSEAGEYTIRGGVHFRYRCSMCKHVIRGRDGQHIDNAESFRRWHLEDERERIEQNVAALAKQAVKLGADPMEVMAIVGASLDELEREL